jgi:hypothetical protein
LREFAGWLAQTAMSNTIAANLWVIPFTQSVHILAIATASISLFMVVLRIWSVAGEDMTLAQVDDRFRPWLWGSMTIALLTGIVMVVGEPARELLAFSFWAKMVLLAIGCLAVLAFQRRLRRDPALASGASASNLRVMAGVVLIIWIGVIFMGRFIAWDVQIWGSLSPSA